MLSFEIADKLARETNNGYWSVNGYYFLGKAECLRYATSIKNFDVKFHFNDNFYASLRWDKEPNENLKSLYKRRAKQLREKYDYIVLAYSGGADSTNVLRSFLDNGIHLDEIVCTYPIKAIEKLYNTFVPNDRKPSNLIFEYIETAKPRLEMVSQQFPKTKITIIDHTDTSIYLATNVHLMALAGLISGPSMAGRFMIIERMRENQDKGRVALITGNDKPRIGYSPKYKNFKVWFEELSVFWGNHDRSLQVHGGFKPNIEHFYYTTDFPELWQKQCFVLRNALMNMATAEVRLPIYKSLLSRTLDTGFEVFDTHHDYFKKLLYEDWSTELFQVGKTVECMFQETIRSEWFYTIDEIDKRTKDYQYGQISEYLLYGIDPKFIIYDEFGKPKRFNLLFTDPITIP